MNRNTQMLLLLTRTSPHETSNISAALTNSTNAEMPALREWRGSPLGHQSWDQTSALNSLVNDRSTARPQSVGYSPTSTPSRGRPCASASVAVILAVRTDEIGGDG